MTVEGIRNFFRSISDRYGRSTAESSSSSPLLTLTRTYSWYPKPIEELLPAVFESFLSKFSESLPTLKTMNVHYIICALTTAVQADIRVTRSISAECVATILAAFVNRVHQLTTSSFPLATMELHAAEMILHEILEWIVRIFYSLAGIKHLRKTLTNDQFDEQSLLRRCEVCGDHCYCNKADTITCVENQDESADVH